MAPHAKEAKQCVSKSEAKVLHEQLLEKLKLEEEKEKKKLEKEARRRAELEKLKQESLQMQASLPINTKNKKKQNSVSKKSNPTSKQSSGSSTSVKTKSSNSPKDDLDIWDETISTSGADDGWSSTVQHNTYASKAKPSSRSRQQPHNSKNKYSRGNSRENSRKRLDSNSHDSYSGQSSRCTPVSDSIWDDDNFPPLGAEAAVPEVNVWEQRMSKAEAIKAIIPQSQYDEEAMLRRALELSMMEAKEEEIRRKVEAEIVLQTEALKLNPELMEVMDPADRDFALDSRSGFESPTALHSTNEEQWPEESNSVSDNVADFSRKDYADNFSQRENSTNFSRKEHATDFNRSDTADSRGARPKITKIIDSFGGWGLKESDKKSKSGKLSDFVDEVIEEDYNSASTYHDVFDKKNVKHDKNVYSNKEDPWNISESENLEKLDPISNTWGNDDVLYDGKGTFTDVDAGNDALDFVYPAQNSQNNDFCDSISQGEELEDRNVFKEEIEKLPYLEKERLDVRMDKHSAYQKSVECENESLSHVDLQKQNESSVNNSVNLGENCYTYRDNYYMYEEKSISKASRPSEHETLNLANNPWDDKPLNCPTVLDSFCDESGPKESDIEHSTKPAFDNEDKFLPASYSNYQDQSPKILPPQSVPSMSAISSSENKIFNGNSISYGNTEPHILPSQLASTFPPQPAPMLPPQPAPMLPPQFPVMSNPLFPNPAMLSGGMNFNPMNPMLGYVMDPVMMRQMLMLSNPFFASQLLAMEQYYKGLGMQTDMFSFQPQGMPNPAGVIGVPLEQNTFANTVDPSNFPNVHSAQFQSQYSNDELVPESENVDHSNEKSHGPPPGLDSFMVHSDSSRAPLIDDGDGDSWYKSFLLDGASAIPPPKPLASKVDEQKSSTSVPYSKESSQNAYSLVQNSVIPNNVSAATSNLHEVPQNNKPLSAVEACMTKTENSGWGDLEDESTETYRAKSAYSWGDDGWGDDNLPAKSVKSSVVYEDKRKPAYRQPASQPQISRFQRKNRMDK